MTKVTAEPRGPNDKLAAEVQSQLRGMVGLSIAYTVHPNGQVRDPVTDIPKATPEAAKQTIQEVTGSLDSTTAVLPNEPIGVGARWDVLTRITGSMDMLQLSTYTLRDRDRTKATLDVEVKQVAATDTLKNPAIGVGRILSMSSSGSGALKIDTSSIVVDSSEVSVRSAMKLLVDVAPGQKADAAVETTTVMRMARR